MTKSIVVDTSVLISAIIGPKGPSREVIRLCLTGHYKPLISNALFQEHEDVASRENILEPCSLNVSELRELLNAYYNTCAWVPIYYLWRPNLPDEGDNFLVELAVAGNAACIITNNVKHIKAAELTFPDIKVSTPDQLLRE